MATLIRPRTWGQTKPALGSGIDWGHPLARGLVICLPLNEAAGFPVELVRGRATVLAPASGAIAWAPTRRGGGIVSTSGDYLTIGTEGTDLTFPTTAITIMVGKWRTIGGNAESAAFGFASQTTVGQTYQAQAHLPWSNGTVYWDFGKAETSPQRLTVAGLTFGADDIWTFSAGYGGSAIWQNGVLRASQATAIVRTAGTKAFQLGNWEKAVGAGYGSETEARYSFFYVWNRELTPAEIRWLQAEPYAFFKAPGSPRFTIDVPAAGATNIPAGHASGTGQAFAASLLIGLTAALASGTGAAGGPSLAESIPAGAASGAGTAYGASLSIGINAGAATGSGAAFDATLSFSVPISAGTASGTGQAYGASLNVGLNAGHAAGTGAAGAPSLTESIGAGAASGTGSAFGASWNLGLHPPTAGVGGFDPGGFDPGGFDVGSYGQAFDAVFSTSVLLPAGGASGSGQAFGASLSLGLNTGHASGTGSAFDAAFSTAIPAGSASGTGEAFGASLRIGVNAGHASGTGEAFDAVLSTVTDLLLTAGHASGTGTAYDATFSVSGGPPTGGGGFVRPKFRIVSNIIRPTPMVVFHAGIARGYGRAYDARIIWDDDETAILLLLGVL